MADLRKVIRGEGTDVALEPDDIVYVPLSPYRYLRHYAEIILNTFVSSAAIDAGSHCIIAQPTQGAGVFIPVGSGVKVIPPTFVPSPAP